MCGGSLGAFDFYGDYYCDECLSSVLEDEEDDGYDPYGREDSEY